MWRNHTEKSTDTKEGAARQPDAVLFPDVPAAADLNVAVQETLSQNHKKTTWLSCLWISDLQKLSWVMHLMFWVTKYWSYLFYSYR